MIVRADHGIIVDFCRTVSYNPSGDFKAIAEITRNGLQSVVGYDHWAPNSVQMHVWIPGILSRNFIREAFRYPFEIGGRGLVVGVTPGDNTKALKLNSRLGFRQTYRVKNGWSCGVDMVIQEMKREECKWLEPHGWISRISESAVA